MMGCLPFLIGVICVTMVNSGSPENEIRKTGGLESDILENLKTIRAEMLTLRTHLSKLSRRSKLMYSILKEKDSKQETTKG